MNKLWYNLLPDGHMTAFATYCNRTGPVSYIQPAVKAPTLVLQDLSIEWSSLVAKYNITAVLPIRDLDTGHAKEMRYTNGSKTMNVSSIVSVEDKISENMKTNRDAWYTMLVHKIKKHFGIKILFCRNTAQYGMSIHTSLDSQFLTEVVANLALISYQDSIEDSSFF